MFSDKAEITVRSGKGGDGAIAFRHEKYVPNGGPDGGDGGRGGDVVLVADSSVNNLVAFRYKTKFFAQNGENGAGGKCSGKNGEGVVIKLPIGSAVFDKSTGDLLCDFTEAGQEYVAAEGGRGGSGNQHYANSTRQAPRFAKPGDEAVEKELVIELLLIADVGLVGFPNVGKSTLLSMVTNAKPKIADYHFTTLTPNLGVVKHKDADEFIIADIPGLIEGASSGAGLGHDFLRHIERTRLLIHVIDVSGSEGRDPAADFDTINNELFTYSDKLRERRQIIALNKADMLGAEETEKIKKHFADIDYDVFVISAALREGLEPLMDDVVRRLSETPKEPLFFTKQDLAQHGYEKQDDFTINVENGVYFVTGKMVERLLLTVNLEDYESLSYFQKVLKNKGVFSELEKMGIKDGDSVDIEGYEFEYYR